MNNNTLLSAVTISLMTLNEKFSLQNTDKMFSKVSSYQVKHWLDKQWDEQKKLEKYITTLNIDWTKGWLMIDDTIIEKKYAEKIECVYNLYSSKNKGFIKGISLTVLLWTNGVKTIPITFMIYEKNENNKPKMTKNEFALNSVQYALGLGIRPIKVCFDSKFASNQLLNYLNDNNLIYFTQLASNRTFNGKQLKMRKFQPYTEIGKLKGVRHKVSICKYRRRYYASNMTENRVTSQFIVKEYRDRWKIEVLFRNLKQLCHLEECQCQRTIAQRHYVYCCICALMRLEKLNKGSIYKNKKYFQQKMIGFKINGNRALRLFAA